MSEKNAAVFYVIAAIAVLVIFGVIFNLDYFIDDTPKLQSVEYNYFKFYNISGFWETDIVLDGQVYRGTFRFNPFEVEGIPIEGNLSPAFNKPPLFITFNPNSPQETFKYQALATTELSLHLVKALNISVEGACTVNETDACIGSPIVTCDTPNTSVIYIVSEGEPKIVLNNRCITLYGSEFGLIKSVDRMLYQWYNIIN